MTFEKARSQLRLCRTANEVTTIIDDYGLDPSWINNSHQKRTLRKTNRFDDLELLNLASEMITTFRGY